MTEPAEIGYRTSSRRPGSDRPTCRRCGPGRRVFLLMHNAVPTSRSRGDGPAFARLASEVVRCRLCSLRARGQVPFPPRPCTPALRARRINLRRVVPDQRAGLASDFCSSAPSLTSGFLPTPPRGDAVAFGSRFPSSRPAEDLHLQHQRHAWHTKEGAAPCAPSDDDSA
jgi:hypothetical protein